jgi:glycosyltransferase involved in cell wall biosynthesis
MSQKQKVALIVQRYGMQINGGAEMHARMIAERLLDKYDVTVLTSCALDYEFWEPVLPEGETEENGVKIIRFKNKKRDVGTQEKAYAAVKKTFHVYLRYKLFKLFNYWIPFSKKQDCFDKNNLAWLEAQGPAMPDLIDYLRSNNHEYNAFIFFTALYYPTALGILEVKPKSILVPTMHVEAASFFPVYQAVMKSAAWIMYNTLSEKRFSEKIFPIANTKNAVVAVGIDLPDLNTKNMHVLNKFGIIDNYIVYVGRIDKSKGCDELINFFLRYIQQTKQPIKLVMVGKSVLDFKGHEAVIFTGFVSDEEKVQLMMQATALIIPSKYESLSLVLLESLACKVPVIANGNTEVLKDHIDASNGGWAYTNFKSFSNSMDQLLSSKELVLQKGQHGFNYVQENYSWPSVMQKYYSALNDITQKAL